MGHSAKVLCERPTTEQFHALRKPLVTATDMGVVLGLSPWKSTYALVLEKRGLVPPAETNDQQWMGIQMEPILLEAFRRKMGRAVEPNKAILVHPETQWASCTPDGWTHDPFEGLECKAVGLGSARHWGEPGTLELPPLYLVQVMWSLYVTNLDRWWIVAGLGTKVQLYPVDRDQEMIYKLKLAGEEFYRRYIVGNETPDPTASDVDLVTSQFPISQEGVLDETPELRSLAEALAAGRAREAEGKRMAGDARAKLELAMGEKEKLKLADGGITWRTAKSSTSIDYEEIVVEAIAKLPSKYSIQIQKMIPKHTVTKPGARSFRPYGQLFEKEES